MATRMDTDAASRLRRQLETAQHITHVGSWEWDLASGAVTWSDELYRIYGLVPGAVEITLEVFLDRVHPDDRDRVRQDVMGALERGGRFAHQERIIWPDGSVRELESMGEVTKDDQGRPAGLIGTCRDVTELRELERARVRAQQLQDGERRALEMLASGFPLEEILAVIVRLIEEQDPGTMASILLLDDSGTHLLRGAAPSLPEQYNQAIEGAPIGPRAGSCGTAAFRRSPVVVVDIETDPLWADYRELALPHGLRACWSTPILANDGRVLGTFAIYYREPRAPDRAAEQLIARATHVAGIAIERRQLDEQLRALSEGIEAIREDERAGIAREIHDELGQSLTALKMDLAWVGRRLDEPTTVAAKLDEMSRATDEIIRVVRRISAELRPVILDDLGLEAALEWQAEEFAERTGVDCVLQSNAGTLALEPRTATALFRIFQEALTNVARHARATRVSVTLEYNHDTLSLQVVDDGVGVPQPVPRGPRLGLVGMRERARRLGGTCTVAPHDPRGTVVWVEVPCRTNTDADIPV